MAECRRVVARQRRNLALQMAVDMIARTSKWTKRCSQFRACGSDPPRLEGRESLHTGHAHLASIKVCQLHPQASHHLLHPSPLPPAAPPRPFKITRAAPSRCVQKAGLNATHHPKRATALPAKSRTEGRAKACCVRKRPRAPAGTRQYAPGIRLWVSMDEATSRAHTPRQVKAIVDRNAPDIDVAVLGRQGKQVRVRLTANLQETPCHPVSDSVDLRIMLPRQPRPPGKKE